MNNFKRFRELHDESQQDVADFLGIERSTYTKYESERKAPPFQRIQLLAEHWGTSVSALMGTDEKNPTGIPDEVYNVVKSFNSLPPDGQKEALVFLDFLKQKYKKQKD